MSRLLVPILGLALVLGAQGAFAQRAPDKYVSDQQVKAALTRVLEHISKAECADSKPCAPATAAEKAHPPISISEARAAMKTGMLSGIAQHCGLDWQRRTFAPMMTHYRKTVQMNERQTTLMALLHGMQQGMLVRALKTSGPCSPDTKAKLDAQLPGRE